MTCPGRRSRPPNLLTRLALDGEKVARPATNSQHLGRPLPCFTATLILGPVEKRARRSACTERAYLMTTGIVDAVAGRDRFSLRAPRFVFAILAILGCAHDTGRDLFPLRERTARQIDLQRPFVFRLAGSAQWRSCPPTEEREGSIPSECANNAPPPGTLAALSELAAQARAARASSDGTWSAAAIDLALGARRRTTLDSVIAALERLAEHDGPAEILSDLAVGYAVRGEVRRNPWDLVTALDWIERAWERDTASAVIAFNRALVLQRLHLFRSAHDAWARGIALQADDSWRQEARGHLARLERESRPSRFVDARAMRELSDAALRDSGRADPQGAREHMLNALLPAWGVAVTTGDGVGAANALHDARVLAGSRRDSSLSSALRELDEVPTGSRSLVAGALGDYGAGARLFEVGDVVRAAELHARAARTLRAAKVPALAAWAELIPAAVSIYGGRYSEAEARFGSVARDATDRADLALLARAEWGTALSAARRGDQTTALARYDRAATLFERLGERANRASMLSQQADILYTLGRDDSSLSLRLEALAELEARHDARQRHGLLLTLGLHLFDSGLPNAARVILREAVNQADAVRRKDRPEAVIRLASLEASLGRYQEASRLLREAATAPGVRDDTLLRQRLEIEDAAARAHVLAEQAPAEAIAQQGRVIEYSSRMGILVTLAPALATRARWHLAVRDTARAEQDLEAAGRAIEAQRVPIERSAARELAATRRTVYYTLVAIRLARGDTVGALAMAGHARGAVGDAPRVAPGLIIDYTVLDDAVLAWTISQRGVRVRRVAASSAAVLARVERYEHLLEYDPDSIARNGEARALYSLLLVDVLPDTVTEVTIVPDGSLGRLPFASLVDGHGHAVVERTAIRYAESVTDALRQRARRNSDGITLLIGNPAFSRQDFPDLEPLRGAAREIAAVRMRYGDPLILEGSSATRDTLLRLLPRTALMHFAGHARLAPGAPSNSHLVLAAGAPGTPAILTAAEVAKLDLRRLRLAILSSCGTSESRARTGRVDNGLVTAFLSGGAQGVISSLWEVDDDATADLMAVLHRELAAGVAVPEALRRAQVEVRQRGGRGWETFRYQGV